MALIVQKFGGSSVADRDRIFNVARIVSNTHNAGNDVVVVVSAQGDTTDDLLAKAAEITHDPSGREMDMLLAAGEEISIALLTMALQSMGYFGHQPDGLAGGLPHGLSPTPRPAFKRLDTERIRKRAEPQPRGGGGRLPGSEQVWTTSRPWAAAARTPAQWPLLPRCTPICCQIFTDVEGVYTADPRKVPNAKKLEEISFDEMLELASLGAQVLNNRSVELAKKYGVELEVLSSLNPVPGTVVKEVAKDMEGMLIKGVAKDTDVAVITIMDVPDVPGMSFKVFGILAQKKINVDIILQAGGRDNTKDLTFTVPLGDAETAISVLEENKARYGGGDVKLRTDFAKVSIVGAGMQSHSGVASRMFEALYESNINIHMISTSEIKISVIIEKKDADRAVAAIHNAFIH